MKHKLYYLACILLFLLAACTAKEYKPEKEPGKEKPVKEEQTKEEQAKEEQAKEGKTEEEKNGMTRENVDLDYHLQKPVISAQEVLTYQKIELPSKINNKKMAVLGFYDDDHFLLSLENITALEETEYGLLDVKSQSYQPLLLPPGKGKMLAGIVAHSENYIVYLEYRGKSEFDRISDDDEPLTIFLKAYDLKQKQIVPVHTYSDFYPYSAMHFKNKVALKGDKLYFNDFNETGTDADLYCYDLTKKKVETMKSGYQNPGLYQGEPVAIGRSGAEYDTIYRLSGEKVVSLPENIIELSVGERGIFALNNKNTDEVLRVTTFSINDLLSGEELLETMGSISQPDSNQYYLCWQNYTDQPPMLYNLEKGCFLAFDDLPKGIFGFELRGSGGLLICYAEEGTTYYRFDRK